MRDTFQSGSDVNLAACRVLSFHSGRREQPNRLAGVCGDVKGPNRSSICCIETMHATLAGIDIEVFDTAPCLERHVTDDGTTAIALPGNGMMHHVKSIDMPVA